MIGPRFQHLYLSKAGKPPLPNDSSLRCEAERHGHHEDAGGGEALP